MRLRAVLFIFMIALTGCSEKREAPEHAQGNETVAQNESDYQNVFIYELKDESVVIAPSAEDPEASYPAYEVLIDDQTKVEGRKDRLEDLREDDHVEVWEKRKGEEQEVAVKIVVDK
ncbi:hypothetical protein [Halobacillus sp. A5]|uniref:hypothetical protein n=1 Tax=Halobacillus sp. A5 TaxID=2880263 RepID=UPI0020A6C68C|nr:hypothetical protein [Halobacillus sp. A5]MCP3027801.1 hypothetical protein [Halobacillus sp. A5]